MVALLEIVFDVVASLVANFAGFAPDRPVWLRRLVQALWATLGIALVVVAAYSFLLLVQHLV